MAVLFCMLSVFFLALNQWHAFPFHLNGLFQDWRHWRTDSPLLPAVSCEANVTTSTVSSRDSSAFATCSTIYLHTFKCEKLTMGPYALLPCSLDALITQKV